MISVWFRHSNNVLCLTGLQLTHLWSLMHMRLYSFSRLARNHCRSVAMLQHVSQTWRPLFRLFVLNINSDILIGRGCSVIDIPEPFICIGVVYSQSRSQILLQATVWLAETSSIVLRRNRNFQLDLFIIAWHCNSNLKNVHKL